MSASGMCDIPCGSWEATEGSAPVYSELNTQSPDLPKVMIGENMQPLAPDGAFHYKRSNSNTICHEAGGRQSKYLINTKEKGKPWSADGGDQFEQRLKKPPYPHCLISQGWIPIPHRDELITQ